MDWIPLGQACIVAARQALAQLPEVRAITDNINMQTNADVASHNAILQTLKSAKVACMVWSEESKHPIALLGGNTNIEVIVDPLDNTLFYLRGEQSFCSIALMVCINQKPRYAFIGDISTGDVYLCDGTTAYKNGTPLKISRNSPGRKIILGWAPYQQRWNRLSLLAPLTKKDYYLYNYGGQLQTVKIATGHYDAYVEVRAETLNEFCGALIVERAGGKVSTLSGDAVVWNPTHKQTLLVARDSITHKQILERLAAKDFEN